MDRNETLYPNWMRTIYDLRYETALPLSVCIQKILEEPWTYGTKILDELWYQCEQLTNSSLRIEFTGGQYRSARRTEYLAEFTSTPNGTVILMFYQGENLFRFLGGSFRSYVPPYTPFKLIDQFMWEKAQAKQFPVNTAR